MFRSLHVEGVAGGVSGISYLHSALSDSRQSRRPVEEFCGGRSRTLYGFGPCERYLMTTAAKTVREIVIENPSSTRVFEQLGIDYCCGGGKSLEQACLNANLDIDRVVDSLEKSQALPSSQAARDWQKESLAALIAHIENSHHKYTREELTRLALLFDKVCAVHGKKHPELSRIREAFEDLYQELVGHMMKEEMVLFPCIKRMEAATM